MSATFQTQGAAAEVDMLKVGVQAHREAIKRTVDDVGRCLKRVAACTDIVDAFGATGELIVATEALKAVSTDAATKLREYLAARMESTGATTIRTEGFTFGVGAAAQTVVITDKSKIPSSYLTTPEPAPDKVAMGRLMRAGEIIPGAALSNGGPGHLTIRAVTK